jgi:hypothetical protein
LLFWGLFICTGSVWFVCWGACFLGFVYSGSDSVVCLFLFISVCTRSLWSVFSIFLGLKLFLLVCWGWVISFVVDLADFLKTKFRHIW